MKRIKLGLRAKFLIFVLLGVGSVAGALALVSFYETQHVALQARKLQLYDLAKLKASELSARLQKASLKAESLATALDVTRPVREEEVYALISGYMKDSPDVQGMAAAYAPYAFDSTRKLFSPYMFRDGKKLKRQGLGNETYNYPGKDWYRIPARNGKACWSEPYFDEGGGSTMMTTYSHPLIVDGKLKAITTADVFLDRLGRDVSNLVVGHEGWAFLISSHGIFLAAKDESLVNRESIFSFAARHHRPDIDDLGTVMVKGQSGVKRIKDWQRGEALWLGYAPVPGPGWSLAVMVPESEIIAPAKLLARKQAVYGLFGLAFMVLIVLALVFKLTGPLKRLSQGVAQLAHGDLSTKVEGIPPGDEVGDLAQAFNNMVDDLDRYINELTEATASKQRIESELDLARQIQQSILPRTYPAYPDRDEFDLFGKTIPAMEVGGDFYDFFMLDDDHLVVVIADVSGKGVPSALFMTVSRTLIKNSAMHHKNPVETMEQVNRLIEVDNEMCMFVTVFYGLYQVSTGELSYVSAGHPGPLWKKKDGAVGQLPRPGGTAIGITPEPGLKPGKVVLEQGELILCFTDGLDEAINEGEEQYGLKRAEAWLASTENKPAPKMLDELVADQKKFTGDVEQFDDLTLLLLRRRK